MFFCFFVLVFVLVYNIGIKMCQLWSIIDQCLHGYCYFHMHICFIYHNIMVNYLALCLSCVFLLPSKNTLCYYLFSVSMINKSSLLVKLWLNGLSTAEISSSGEEKKSRLKHAVHWLQLTLTYLHYIEGGFKVSFWTM